MTTARRCVLAPPADAAPITPWVHPDIQDGDVLAALWIDRTTLGAVIPAEAHGLLIGPDIALPVYERGLPCFVGPDEYTAPKPAYTYMALFQPIPLNDPPGGVHSKWNDAPVRHYVLRPELPAGFRYVFSWPHITLERI